MVNKTAKKKWPQIGDRYWIINDCAELDGAFWDDDKIDKWHVATGNIFRTEEEALEYRAKIMAKSV